jgi:hypothetical protein
MDKTTFVTRANVFAVLFGAAAGGIGVAVVTKAVPVMMSRIMSNMMEDMMARTGGEGCDPEEM